MGANPARLAGEGRTGGRRGTVLLALQVGHPSLTIVPCRRNDSVSRGSPPGLLAVPTTLTVPDGDEGPQAGEPPATPAASAADGEQLASEWLLATRSTAVTEWRTRVHAARRRTILVVMAAVRLQTALRGNNRRRKMRPVDSFSYYIPGVLGTDLKRFLVSMQSL